ncbi:hypothetical protein [Thalassobacillus hwangdonensis]|uniref:Uncharacterized protein n=1 Tax=Thalassobacillus hwangdonensis TaxID=546108 RepID=A0ABW3L122_9BACI
MAEEKKVLYFYLGLAYIGLLFILFSGVELLSNQEGADGYLLWGLGLISIMSFVKFFERQMKIPKKITVLSKVSWTAAAFVLLQLFYT